jgi:hypothetical protein
MEIHTEVFAEWLFRGLGRPYLHLQSHDSRPFHEALLHACLSNPIYDRQCEGTRTAYLSGLVALTSNPSMFKAQIIDAFAAPDERMDFEQLFDFALLFAKAGDSAARQLMYRQFAAYAGDGNDIGAAQLIDLDGLQGFQFVAARLGDIARADPDFWDTDYLISQVKDRAAGAVTDADIEALGAADPSVRRYLDVVVETTARRQKAALQRHRLRDEPYAALKERLLARQQKLSIYQLKQWGPHAREQDLDAAADDLLRQEDPHSLASYLAIFNQRPFPRGFRPLLPFVRHTDERVVRQALQALSLFQSAELRDLGLALLSDHWQPSDSLNLFVRNYQPGDERIFLSLLEAAQSHDEVHALGYGLIDILAQNAVVEAVALRSLLYERQPCSLCRTKVVRQLVTSRTIPAWMLEECQFDADEDTRQAVTSYAT